MLVLLLNVEGHGADEAVGPLTALNDAQGLAGWAFPLMVLVWIAVFATGGDAVAAWTLVAASMGAVFGLAGTINGHPFPTGTAPLEEPAE